MMDAGMEVSIHDATLSRQGLQKYVTIASIGMAATKREI